MTPKSLSRAVLAIGAGLLLLGGRATAANSGAAPPPAGSLVLVEKNIPKATVVLADEPAPGELQAADQLKSYVRKMSGAELAVVRQNKNPEGLLIRLGRACGALADEAKVADGFTIQTGDNAILIKGANDRGTYYGVCELLEKLGVRWFLPEELGEVVPQRDTLTVDSLCCKQQPDFPMRWIGKKSVWPLHARSNVLEENPMGLRINGSFHTFSQFLPAEKYFDKVVC